MIEDVPATAHTVATVTAFASVALGIIVTDPVRPAGAASCPPRSLHFIVPDAIRSEQLQVRC